MSRYVGSYVAACDLCLRTKAQHRLPVGELQPLPMLNDCWETVSVDFIVELPESGGYDAVMVIVDSASKRAHFCETTTTDMAAGAANLYLRHVWKLHGLPRKVISDRGPQFVALFMKELFRLNTGRHPRMGFEPRQPPSKVEAVNDFTDRMKSTLEEAKSAIAKAKDDMAQYYNQRRTPAPVYGPSDKVYLDASDIHTTRPSKKLSHRRLGLFPVERRIGMNAYRLTLPPLMKHLHPVFNVVKLMPVPMDLIAG